MIRNYKEFQAAITTGWLAIKTGGSADALTARAIMYRKTNGDLASLAAQATVDLSTASWDLSLADTHENVVYVTVNDSGTVWLYAGTSAATWATVVEPTIDNDLTVVWRIWISNASGSAFTIGTTALDTASVTVLYEDCIKVVN